MANIRKPTQLHVLNGTYRPDRHGQLDQVVEITDAMPPCPAWLGTIAREEWNRITTVLDSHKVLKATDYAVLLTYVSLFDQFVTTRFMDVNASLLAQFRACLSDLGLTPTSRHKLKSDEGKKQATSFDNF